MSKQRPSNAQTGEEVEKGQRHELARWEQRLYRNTYTRKGRTFTLNGWSVKIQHRGKRRTFSLTAKTKSVAAFEAQAIHDTIQVEGWDAAVRHHVPRGGRAGDFPKTDERHWPQRLLMGRHGFPGAKTSAQDYTARITHAGTGHFFPLGTANLEAATVTARKIYQTVAERGWNTARRLFPLELTLSLEWMSNPAMWSYTTIHTILERRSTTGPNLPLKKNSGIGLIVETDPGVARAVAWGAAQAGLAAMVCAAPDAFQKSLAQHQPHFVLVNRALCESIGWNASGQIAALPQGMPVLTYSIYSDSDQLFLATPGGVNGYLLKRVPANRILEPFSGAVAHRGFSPDELIRRVQDYFKVLLRPPSARDSSGLASLTRRERDVLALLSKGYIDKEIAPALGISAWTVRGHIKKIFERLGVHTRTEAVVQYLEK